MLTDRKPLSRDFKITYFCQSNYIIICFPVLFCDCWKLLVQNLILLKLILQTGFLYFQTLYGRSCRWCKGAVMQIFATIIRKIGHNKYNRVTRKLILFLSFTPSQFLKNFSLQLINIPPVSNRGLHYDKIQRSLWEPWIKRTARAI